MRTRPDSRTLQLQRSTQQKLSGRRWPGLVLGTIAIASTGLAACRADSVGEDRADLNDILEDGDLGVLMRSSALKMEPPSTGAGGTTGAAGTTGIAGTAGPSTGIAGVSGATDGGMPGPGAAGTGGRPPFPTGGAGSFGGDGGSPMGPFPQFAQGLWQFDDCNSFRTDLSDSTFNRHPAFRSLSVACTMGVQNQGLAIDQDEDLVYVPDQPSFTFDSGMTVAAWVKPTRLGGVRTIFRKREEGTSTFFLGENGKEYQLVIRLANGKAADVSAKATLNKFTHVAGTYDGHELLLYLDGKVAARKVVNGRLSAGAGPLLMGNDAKQRRIEGTIDNVFLDVTAATADQIVRLTCLPRAATISIAPDSRGPVAPGTEVTYEAKITNNSCDGMSAFVNTFAQTTSLFVNPPFDFRFLEPGATAQVPITVGSAADIEPDDHRISIQVSTSAADFFAKDVIYSVQGTPCSVRSRKELEIRDVSVVEDPVRTAPGGAWTFGKLMEAMAPTPADAPAMVEALLSTWLTDQTIGGFTVPARPGMQDLVLGPFPRLADGRLDLTRAPFRLLAIVNRIDLNDPVAKTAGEGRFVFGFLDQFGNAQGFTLILEYRIPAESAQEITNLADAWHALSGMTFPSPAYNAALQAVTDRFVTRNAAPGRPNGSAIGQVRTNDFFALGEWEFREFHLSATTGHLEPAGVALTPDRSLNNTELLSRFINANEESILAQTHTVPSTFEDQPFQGGSMVTDFFVWSAPGVNPEARAKFALNTCNGCHTGPLETGVGVFQVEPRQLGQESRISPFLTGTQVFDPFANLLRNFNELGRRGRILHDLVCPNDPLPPAPPETTPIGGDDGGIGGTGVAGTGGGSFDGGASTGVAGTGGAFPTGTGGTGGKL